jgi:hypothetical protein
LLWPKRLKPFLDFSESLKSNIARVLTAKPLVDHEKPSVKRDVDRRFFSPTTQRPGYARWTGGFDSQENLNVDRALLARQKPAWNPWWQSPAVGLN